MENIEIVNIDTIKPYDKNPRKNDKAVEKVAKSISLYGFQQPIVVDQNNVIVVGHTRYKAAQHLKIQQVPITYAKKKGRWLSESECKAYRIADNKTNEFASWDDDLLKIEMESLKIEIPDISLPDLTGFSEGEILNHVENKTIDAEPQISKAEELQKKWQVQPGDIYRIGAHRLMCGDSTSSDDVRKLMDGKKASLFSTDPPYGVAYGDETGSDKYDTIANDENDSAKLQSFLEQVFKTASHFLEKNAAWYIWHAQMTQGYFSAAAAAAAADVIIHRQIIWVKPSLVMGHGDYHWRHELCYYGWVKGNRPKWYSDRKQTTVWEIGKENDGVHPTQKPVEIFQRPMINNTLTGDICYEPFSGSGTQFVAAQNTGRICYGIEISPAYCSVILERMKTAFPDILIQKQVESGG